MNPKKGAEKDEFYEGLRDGFYPHSEECDRWVKCEDGKEVSTGLCPDGLVFNSYASFSRPRCELPFGVDCTTRPKLQPPQPTEQCPRLYGMFRHDADCSKYKHCDNGIMFEGTCPEGLSFSEEYGVCDWTENVAGCAKPQKSNIFNCPAFNAAQFTLVGNPRFPDPEDCRKFYVCIVTFHDTTYSMIPRHLACEEGRVFNSKKNECDEPENVVGCEKYYEVEKYGNELN
ncbi:peritrophin-1-like protein [Dinothrombium tinctorium]|uniref:Peritrophin-1-like protein n=1 Tax=Dinothrombium tinctorium TaxID=1965070 RepID=A0A443QXE9_9ACAR|nr:peritrophin-1-like protein [Dinothrombium tinctorium]